MKFLEEIFASRRFGMKPGLETICAIASALGDPQLEFPSIHIAGTNGKGAVSAMLDGALRSLGLKIARYTSPHLVAINERFFIDGMPLADEKLENGAKKIAALSKNLEPSFFESLTALAFSLFAEEKVDFAVLETGLGGRLDATNICRPSLTIITRIGLDHCDWLGDTLEAIAKEKGGIIKKGVPVILGENAPEVVEIIKTIAAENSAPFIYAPDIASEAMIPASFSLPGSFNRENAMTAIAALIAMKNFRILPPKILESFASGAEDIIPGIGAFTDIVWPGRFQRIGRFIVDGAHNPPAALALARALSEENLHDLVLVAGFCGDKDIDSTLNILKPFVSKALAIKTNNPRALEAEALAEKMRSCGIDAESSPSLHSALERAKALAPSDILICGSLFLVGEALIELDAYPWPINRFDPSELLATSR